MHNRIVIMTHPALVTFLTLLLAVGKSHQVSNCSSVVVTGADVHSGTYVNDTTVTDGSASFVMELGNQTSYLERGLGFRRRRRLAETTEGRETSIPDDRAREDDRPDERSGVPDVVDLAYTAAAARESLELFCPIWLIRGFEGNETFLPPMYLVNDCHLHPVDIKASWGEVQCADCAALTSVNITIVCAEETTIIDTSTSGAAREGFTQSLVPTFAVGATAVLAAAVSHVVMILVA